MRPRLIVLLLMPLIILTLFAPGSASVELDVLNTFTLEQAPLDIAVSLNGRLIYVLSKDGILHIYTADGVLRDSFAVDKNTDGVKPGPREDILFLTSNKAKKVQIVTLDPIHNINTLGSPFKGPVDAPTVIAVFSDFQ